jgi:predicted nucleotidyltransferase
MLAFQRIAAVLRLYAITCKLFGSCASGIAIKDSDIDIAISQNVLDYFQCHNQKYRMDTALDFIAQVFESMSWIS